MNKGFEKKKLRIATVLALLLLFTISISVYAASNAKIMATKTVDDHLVKIYVRNGNAGDDVSLQIGNTPTENPKSYGISEDENPMRTLIMLDNSLSIPEGIRANVLDLMGQMVNNHSENELFRIATFSNNINYLSDRYSDDYTSLLNVISNISFNNQDTLLTNVLYGVIDDLNAERYPGYTRIVIIADGVNNNPTGGKTLDMIRDQLNSYSYPIYTVGCETGKNKQELDNLFLLSTMTGCEYMAFDVSKLNDISNMVSADNEIVVYEAEIPESIMDGNPRKGKLTLGDGTELVADIEIPFIQLNDNPEPVPEPECICEDKCTQETINEECPVCSENYSNCKGKEVILAEEPMPEKSALPWEIIAGIVLLVLAAGGVIAYLLISKKKKENKKDVSSSDTDGRPGTLAYDENERPGTIAFEEGGTAAFMPDDIQAIITLTDKFNKNNSWRAEIVNSITIGRSAEDYTDNINFKDDENQYMHAHHCTIECRGGDYYIKDNILGKKKRTHTKMNGNKLDEGEPYMIQSGDEISIGDRTYVIEIERAY
ncbi:FHA domain protein [Lachnospiraceae bacterium XBB2008]|nr:FHA domain protein [Lachnospiraceae bacterium XBB2008]